MGRFQIDFEVSKDKSVLSIPFGPAFLQEEEKDALTGVWAAILYADGIPEGQNDFTLELKLGKDGEVTGLASSPMGDLDVTEGTFNAETNKMQLFLSNEESGISIVINVNAKSTNTYVSTEVNAVSIEQRISCVTRSLCGTSIFEYFNVSNRNSYIRDRSTWVI